MRAGPEDSPIAPGYIGHKSEHMSIKPADLIHDASDPDQDILVFHPDA